jgi:hypothetical protein
LLSKCYAGLNHTTFWAWFTPRSPNLAQREKQGDDSPLACIQANGKKAEEIGISKTFHDLRHSRRAVSLVIERFGPV